MKLPVWLAGQPPTLTGTVRLVRLVDVNNVQRGNRRRLRWLWKRRKDPAYRAAELARLRERRAAKRRTVQ